MAALNSNRSVKKVPCTPLCLLSNKRELRQKFEYQVSLYFKQQNRPQPTRPYIKSIIQSLKDFKVRKKQCMPVTTAQKQYAAWYGIGGTHTDPFLLKTNERFTGRYKEIVPCEDYYNLLLQVHIDTNHGKSKQMAEVLYKQKYKFIPMQVIRLFQQMHHNCSPVHIDKATIKQATQAESKTRQGIVELIDLQDTPDGKYQWILYYQDEYTKFSILRPLKTNQVQDVAKEVLKIFFDIGFPTKLKSKLGIGYVARIILEIKLLWPYGDLKVLTPTPIENNLNLPDIVALISRWEKTKGPSNTIISSSQWATHGIYVIQHELNTSRQPKTNVIPIVALLDRESMADPARSLNLQVGSKGRLVDEFKEFNSSTERLGVIGRINVKRKIVENEQVATESDVTTIDGDDEGEDSTSECLMACGVCEVWCVRGEKCSLCGQATHTTCGDTSGYQGTFVCTKCNPQKDSKVKKEAVDIDDDNN